MWRLLSFIVCLMPWMALAVSPASNEPVGIGLVAENMLAPVGVAADFVHTACFVIGGSFLFTSLIKYMEHRRSPTMVPISTVVFLVVAGLILILLPFLAYLSDNGVRYSLLR